jgi:hypothetical protein
MFPWQQILTTMEDNSLVEVSSLKVAMLAATTWQCLLNKHNTLGVMWLCEFQLNKDPDLPELAPQLQLHIPSARNLTI